jgi:tetratricopeptide (TPR) repeat protein
MHLDRVNERTFEKSVLILSGLSGTGKSQLAAAYVKSQLNQDPRREIFWINGRDKKIFETSIVQFHRDNQKPQISTQTQVAEDTDKQTSEAVESFLEGLNQPGNTGWLMVLDDVTAWNEGGAFSTDSVDLSNYLDRISQGSILMTTNRQNWLIGHGNVLRVGGLDEAAAMGLLKSKLHGHYTLDEGMFSPKDMMALNACPDLLELARVLQCLPLCLRLAITYILKRGIRAIDYVHMWKERKLDDTLPLVEPTLVQTLNLCFEELESRDVSAGRLLTLFGFLDHRNLSYDLVSKAESLSLPRWLLAIGTDKKAFDGAIEALVDLSFVQLANDTNQGNVYSIHPAVHAFARLRAGGSKEDYISWAISLVADNVPRSLDKDYWRKAQALGPHADQCMAYIRTGRFHPQNLERIGALFRLLGRYDEASRLYNVVLRCLSPHRNAFLETTAQVLNDLGLVYYGQHNFELAVKTFHDSIGVYSQLPAPLQTAGADTLMCVIFNYGNACRMVRDLEAAETAFNQVYEFLDSKKRAGAGQVLSWVEVIVSRVLNALGELRLERKETRNAMSMFRRALSTQEEHLESNHPIILSTKMNLGRAYTDLGSYSEACEMLQDLVMKYKEQFGANHEAVITATDELARASMGHGQSTMESNNSESMGMEALKEAEQLWMDNLAYYGEKYGAESEDALRTKANIALLQSVTGDLNMARRNMLQVFQRSTIPAQKVKAQCDLALICQQMGDFDVAKINFHQAVEASKSLSEPTRTRELFRSMYHQAQLYLSLGDQNAYVRVLEDLTSQQAVEVNEWQQRARSEQALAEVPDLADRRTSQGSSGFAQNLSVLPQSTRKRKWQMD